jgi:hypothetical protein
MAAMAFETITAQTADVNFNSTESYRSWPYKVDTLTGTTEVGRTFGVKKDYKYNYYVEVSADSLNAADSAMFILKGSNNDIVYWPIDTVVWHLSTPDTTVYFDSGSTYVRWRYLKPTLVGTNAATQGVYGPANVTVNK